MSRRESLVFLWPRRVYGGKLQNYPKFWRLPKQVDNVVLRGKRGTSWHSRVSENVSKVVVWQRGRRKTFASFSEDELYFSNGGRSTFVACFLRNPLVRAASSGDNVANSVAGVACSDMRWHSTLDSTLYTPWACTNLHSTLWHSTLHTLHSTLHTLHSTHLYTLHSTLYTPHMALHTSHFILHTLHFTLHTPHFTLYTPHFTLRTLRITLHTLHSTLYTPHCTLYTPPFDTPHCTLLHSALWRLETPHFTLHLLYTLHSDTPHFIHFTLHTLQLGHFGHFTLHTSTLHTLHSTLLHSLHSRTLHSTLYTSTLRTLHFTLHTLHSTLHALHSTLRTCTLYTPHFALRTPHSTLWHSSMLTLHIVSQSPLSHSARHIPHSTLHFEPHTPHWLHSSLFRIPPLSHVWLVRKQGKYVQDCSNSLFHIKCSTWRHSGPESFCWEGSKIDPWHLSRCYGKWSGRQDFMAGATEQTSKERWNHRRWKWGMKRLGIWVRLQWLCWIVSLLCWKWFSEAFWPEPDIILPTLPTWASWSLQTSAARLPYFSVWASLSRSSQDLFLCFTSTR